MLLSVIIPVYNEEQTIQEVHGRAAAVNPGGIANRFLTLLTNVLVGVSACIRSGALFLVLHVPLGFEHAELGAYRRRLTDMETAYKALRREALAGLRLRRVGFDIDAADGPPAARRPPHRGSADLVQPADGKRRQKPAMD